MIMKRAILGKKRSWKKEKKLDDQSNLQRNKRIIPKNNSKDITNVISKETKGKEQIISKENNKNITNIISKTKKEKIVN